MVARLSFLCVCSIVAGVSCTPQALPNAEQERSCMTRLAWSDERARACATCRTSSVEPRCDCPDIGEKYKSQCRVQAASVQAFGGCTDAQRVAHSGCVARCHDDCACEAACMDALPYGCARAQQDMDTCVTDTCNEVCR